MSDIQRPDESSDWISEDQYEQRLALFPRKSLP